MKELVGVIKKDLEKLHKSLKKEGDELVRQVKEYAASDDFKQKRKEVETFVSTKLKEFEPKVEKFIVDVKKGAKKHGLDLPGIEKKFNKAAKFASKKIKELHDNYKQSHEAKKAAPKKAAAKPKAKAKAKKK